MNVRCTSRRAATPALALLAPALLAVPFLAVPGGATAQGPIALTSLEIDLWPEYDRPGVLVIYRATLSPGVDLPAVVSFRIPAAAGDPNAVAERRGDGRLATLPHGREQEGDWARITFTASFPVVQIEFYDPRIERNGDARRFDFTWPGDYAAGEISLSVQEPDRARGLIMTPAAGRSTRGSDGLTYHTLGVPAVAAGRSFDLTVTYEKATDQLTVDTVAPVSQQAAEPAGREPAPSSISWPAIGAGILVALAGIIALVVASRRSRGPDASGGSAVGGVPASSFCTRCGARSSAGDRFCHGCGAPLP